MVIQSFYSCKLDDFNKFLQNCYFCLSSIYLRSSNIPADLYADYDFSQLCEFAPYDNNIVMFEDHDAYNNIDPYVWAWPKFIALDHVSRNVVHLDGDVFLKDASCKKLIDFDGNDVVCQHLEYKNVSNGYVKTYEKSFKSIEHLTFPDFIDKQIPKYMPNNGVIGINNDKLWKKYCDAYWYMCNQCTPGNININCIESDGWVAPDIIFEQYFLKQICDKDNYSIKYILHGNTLNDFNDDAARNKYQHICSDKVKHLSTCIKLIKKKDTRCYEMLKSNWKNKFPLYFE